MMLYDTALYRELDDLPTIDEGYADDLKLCTDTHGLPVDHPTADCVRVWTHRPTAGHIDVEIRTDGRWSAGTDADIYATVQAARAAGIL